MISEEEYLEVRDMFVPFHLPISLQNINFTPEEVLENTKSDKKNATGTLKFILLNAIGEAVIDTTVTDDEILTAVKELIV